MRVSEALESYVLQLQADGRSPHTTGQSRRHVTMFTRAMGDPLVRQVRPEDVARFLASDTVTKDRKPSSANALRSSLRCFFAFVHASGLSQVNAARLVRRARCGPSRPRALAEQDAGTLLRTLAAASGSVAARDRAMIEVMLRGGLRVGSLVGLDVTDLDGDTLRLRTLKNGGEALAYLPAATAALLQAHVGERTSGAMFVGQSGERLTTRHVARRLAYWARKAGVGHVFPHQLRHAFAMGVYARTQCVMLTASALTHRSIASASVYAQPSADAVRRAVAR